MNSADRKETRFASTAFGHHSDFEFDRGARPDSGVADGRCRRGHREGTCDQRRRFVRFNRPDCRRTGRDFCRRPPRTGHPARSRSTRGERQMDAVHSCRHAGLRRLEFRRKLPHVFAARNCGIFQASIQVRRRRASIRRSMGEFSLETAWPSVRRPRFADFKRSLRPNRRVFGHSAHGGRRDRAKA